MIEDIQFGDFNGRRLEKIRRIENHTYNTDIARIRYVVDMEGGADG